MVYDARLNKAVAYNLLNLVQNLSSDGFSVSYNYDADGAKLNKVQQGDYYPFGMEISQGTTPSPKNEYLYNKK